MKRISAVFILLILTLIAITIYIYIRNTASLSGEVVFELPGNEQAPAPDSLHVFVIRASIGPAIDSLHAGYDKTTGAFEDSVLQMKAGVDRLREDVAREEALQKAVFGNLPPGHPDYDKNIRLLDSMKRDYQKALTEYQNKREKLIGTQNQYNAIIAGLIDAKVLLRAPLDRYGRFEISKLPPGDYYMYCYRVIAGGKDITLEPPATYYLHALAAQRIHKFSWMHRISVRRNTEVRLDPSNMTDVFK